MSGWNRSGQRGNSTPIKPKATVKKPSPMRGIVAGGLVIVLAAVAYFAFFFGNDAAPAPSTKHKAPGTIKAVTPAAAPKAEEPAPEKPKKKFWEVDASETNGFSEVMQHKWRVMHRPKPTHTNDIEKIRHRAKSSIFPHRSENMIAAYLTIEPGQGMIGTPNMRGMTEDFLKSCEVPIIISDEDDEYTRNLKTMMKEAKIELRQRMNEGEKLEDILMDTHKEIQRLGQYKAELQMEFAKYRSDPEHSDQDVADFITAANKLLEQKGVSALSIGPITRNRLKHLLPDNEGKTAVKEGAENK